MINRHRLRSWPLLAGLLLAALPSGGRGDLIFLKDGFVLQGQVKRESRTEVDPISREPIVIPKGFFFVDDGPRRIYFSPTLVRIVEKRDEVTGERITHPKEIAIFRPRRVPPLEELVDATAWDGKWERTVHYRSGGKDVKIPQHMSILSPHWARVDGTAYYLWSCAYLTRELPFETVRSLLSAHPAFVDDTALGEEERAQRRLRYSQFFLQAGWHAEAERELKRLARDLPAQKDLAESALAVLGRIQARDRLEEIKRLHLAGQYERVRKELADFPEEFAGEDVLADVRELQAEYQKVFDNGKELARHLEELAAQVVGERRQLFSEAAATIRSELSPDSLARLDPFLGQARQAERLKRQGRKPTLDTDQLLSLAVSGWLLGGPAAEARPETAVKLWNARSFLLEYLRTDNAGQRQQLLGGYLRDRDRAAPLDWAMQIIPRLPPSRAEEMIPTQPVEMQAEGGAGSGATYLLQLPPEYRHSRTYPVLVVLHDGSEKALTMLRRWSKAAGDEGYILVAPHWQQGLSSAYTYSEAEHASVVESLRDLRRRFNVDSDRVFLFGLGQGADMAFDVGLAHPDLFAGVIPMGGFPNYFALKYWKNGQYLPFLVINGDRSGDSNVKTREIFDSWVLRSYPMVWVQYKGRGIEWFGGEVSNILDWMRKKKRVYPLRQLGTDGNQTGLGNEFTTMREGDTRFYWLSTTSVHPRCLNSVGRWSNFIKPATLTGRIDPVSNSIVVRVSGVQQLSIWLGQNSQGEKMIDWDKPINVTLHLTNRIANRKIEPSYEVLLDDLYQRGDRSMFFLARIDIG